MYKCNCMILYDIVCIMYIVYYYIYMQLCVCECVCVCLDAVLTIYGHLLCAFALSGGWDEYSKQLVTNHCCSTRGCQTFH